MPQKFGLSDPFDWQLIGVRQVHLNALDVDGSIRIRENPAHADHLSGSGVH
jgi:hypothetical protein